ncbi:MAG: hypothetical protein M1817_000610 [Caeruleum heppii]|nr:MAG: hypothetical protein M1817_000610 [Caeruleum heppii]
MPQATVVVIGSLNIDLTFVTPRLPSAGETLTALSFATNAGGKGANQAVACARLSRTKAHTAVTKKRKLGASQDGGIGAGAVAQGNEEVVVRMVGAVGDDEFGRALIKGLEDDGIDVAGIQMRPDSKTGTAGIIVEKLTGENRILISPGANHTLMPEHFIELPAPLPDLIILQLEIPLETVLQILRTAEEVNVPVLLNPAPALKLPNDAFKRITHLIVNETEAVTLSDLPEGTPLVERAMEYLHKGVQYVVVTQGEQGVFFVHRKPDFEEGSVQDGFPGVTVKVVDTTAAGDTFVGAYAVEVVKSIGGAFDCHRAVYRANVVASKCVEREGAQSAIPWLEEIDNLEK